MKPDIILASNSPRRRELLSMLGMDFRVIVSDCDETIDAPMQPDALVRELAFRKAKAVADTLDTARDTIVIGADTIVWDRGRALGKPRDDADARATILSLANHTHSVFTGIALIGCIGGEVISVTDAVETRVVFGNISPEDADWYIGTGEASDKAGSYAVQGLAGAFVTELHGDYYNVVGLPIARMRELLEEKFGLAISDYGLKG